MKLKLFILLLCVSVARASLDRDIFPVEDRTFYRTILEGSFSLGGNDGELIYWDNTTLTWAIAAVGELSWTPATSTLLVDTLNLTNPLTVPFGGTGVASLTDGGILLGSGVSPLTALGVASNGQIPIGDGATDPVLATISDGVGVSVVNGAGSITLNSEDSEIIHDNLSTRTHTGDLLSTLIQILVDDLDLNGNVINSTSGDLVLTSDNGEVSLSDDNLTTTGTGTFGSQMLILVAASGAGGNTTIKADNTAAASGIAQFLLDSRVVGDVTWRHLGDNQFGFRGSGTTNTLALKSWEIDGTTAQNVMTMTQPASDSGDIADILWSGLHKFDAAVEFDGTTQMDGTITFNGASTINSDMTIDDTVNLVIGATPAGTISTDAVDVSLLGNDATSDLIINDFQEVRIGDAATFQQIDLAGDTFWVGAGTGLPYGEIFAQDNTTPTTITSAGKVNKVQITIFDTDGLSNLTTPDHTNDHITIVKAGVYKVSVSMSVASSAGDADKLGFSVYKNNGATEFPNIHFHRDFTAGTGLTGSASMVGLIDVAVDDTIELWGWNEDDTDNFLMEDVTMVIDQKGGT